MKDLQSPGVYLQMVSFLLDLPEKDEEEVERAQINSFDSLWGETGRRHLSCSLWVVPSAGCT